MLKSPAAKSALLDKGVLISPMIEGLGFPRLQSASMLIKSESHNMVVDCGAVENRDVVVGRLAEHGLTPAQIDTVLITHSHFDHMENWDLFTNARFYVHRRELQFIATLLATAQDDLDDVIRSHYVRILDFYVRAIKRRITDRRALYQGFVDSADRMTQLDGAQEVHDDVVMVPSPGHTLGHMSVGVTHGQKPVWICGDAITTRQAWLKRDAHICADVDIYARTCREIQQRGGIVVPGHDRPFDLETLEYVEYSNLS